MDRQPRDNMFYKNESKKGLGFAKALADLEKMDDYENSGPIQSARFVRNSYGLAFGSTFEPMKNDVEITRGAVTSRYSVPVRTSNLKRTGFGSVNDSSSSDSDENPFDGKMKIDAPDMDDEKFEIQSSKGLDKQWESWKGQMKYKFKDEEFDQL